MKPRPGRTGIAISPGLGTCGIGGAINPGVKREFELMRSAPTATTKCADRSTESNPEPGREQ